MRRRCEDSGRKDFAYYGARGIRVCDRWQCFGNFLADMGERPEGYTIDRINGDGDYTPSNCRWASRLTQSRNRAYAKNVTVDGVDYPSIQAACDGLGVSVNTVSWRRARGQTLLEALRR